LSRDGLGFNRNKNVEYRFIYWVLLLRMYFIIYAYIYYIILIYIFGKDFPSRIEYFIILIKIKSVT